MAALLGLLLLVPSPAQARSAPGAVLVIVDGISFEEALAHPAISDLAAGGGIGLLHAPENGVADLIEGLPEEVLVTPRVPRGNIGLALDLLLAPATSDVLVILAAPVPSSEMRAAGDLATPIVVARAGDAGARVAGLTSDSTRRSGIVAEPDVAATFRDHLGLPIEEGSPIRVEGDPPIALHERYLGVRALSTPLQVGVLGVVLAVLAAVAVFVLRGGRSAGVARALGVATLAAITLPVMLLPVSALPRITWATVLTGLALLTALVVAAASWVGRRAGPTAAVGLVGAAALTVLAVDAIQGWEAMAVPILGGGALDGARFFGLGNVYAAVLLSGAALVAAHLGPRGGAALLAGAGLFAGLPGGGSDIGGAVMLFAAAGLWYALRTRRGIDAIGVLWVAGAVAAGVAIVIGAHALFAEDTHIAQAASSGPGGALEIFWRRLRINARTMSAVPVAWLLVLALPASAWAAWKRWGPLARDPEWRDAVLVLSVATLVGVAANDTGVGIAGIGFAFIAAAIAYPALEERWTSR